MIAIIRGSRMLPFHDADIMRFRFRAGGTTLLNEVNVPAQPNASNRHHDEQRSQTERKAEPAAFRDGHGGQSHKVLQRNAASTEGAITY